MSANSDYVTLTEVAKRAGVRLSAVSNWRSRHSDFPPVHVVAGQEVLEEREIAQWLRARKIPRNRLEADEPPGTSYGDRFLGNARPDVDSSAVRTENANDNEQVPRDPAWTANLWAAADRLRDTRDTAAALELLLGLVYVKACRPDVWQSLVDASDWPKVRESLSGVSLRTDAGGSVIPLFRSLTQARDSSVIDVVKLIDEIDFGEEVGPESVGAQIADAILADLERGMGRSGGHVTPPDIVKLLVRLLDPRSSDRVYDPFCGSGELLSAAATHVCRESGSLVGWGVCGQAPHEWSWLTTGMNLAMHGVDAELGVPALALQRDQFPDRRFTRILANPPFGQRIDVSKARTWPFGEPPPHHAELAWLQHAVTKLERGGQAAVIMPAGAAFRGGKEKAIRKAMIEARVVECVIALPSHLFRHTAIPTMLWILSDGYASREETLFIDARQMGEMVERGTRRRLSVDDIGQIVHEYRRWQGCRGAGEFDGEDGFSRAVSNEEIGENDHNLMPGRYVHSATKPPDTATLLTQLGALRDEFDQLDTRAKRLRAVLDTRLRTPLAGQRHANHGRWAPLGTVCHVLSAAGKVPRAEEPSGTPLVLPRNIRDHRVETDGLDMVPPAEAERLRRYRLAAGDIVSARSGTLGRYGLITEGQAGWVLGPGCVRFRPNDQVNPDYLTYYLGGPAAQQWLAEHATGSAIQQVDAATLRTMPIWLPSLATQQAILETVNPFHAAASVHGRLSAIARELEELLVASLMAPSE